MNPATLTPQARAFLGLPPATHEVKQEKRKYNFVGDHVSKSDWVELIEMIKSGMKRREIIEKTGATDYVYYQARKEVGITGNVIKKRVMADLKKGISIKKIYLKHPVSERTIYKWRKELTS